MKFLCQIRLRLISIKGGRMLQGLDLINDCFGNAWVCMAHTNGKHAAKTIEILVALIVPNVKTLAARKCERFLVISGNGREEKFLLFADGFGLGGFWFDCIHMYDV